MGYIVILLWHRIRVGAWACLAICKWLRSFCTRDWEPRTVNVIIGALSAIVDNIPLMFAVLTMDPVMSDGQRPLITLTCGVGPPRFPLAPLQILR